VDTVKLSVNKRISKGSSASNRTRSGGMLPAVVYNRAGNISIEMSTKEFVHAGEKSRTSQVFEFVSEDKELNGAKVIVKDIQKNFLKGSVQHVDFQRLIEGEAVAVWVPLNVHGESVGVKKEGGILTTSCHRIRAKCLPDCIPQIIDVDISSLKLGERIRTGELTLPEGVTLVGNPKENVAGVVSGRQSRLMQQAAANEAAAGKGGKKK
jgi:large subunit ribosomal protein L25